MSRCFAFVGLFLISLASGKLNAAQPPTIIKNYGELPLSFQAARSGSPSSYVARGQGYMIALDGSALTIGVQPAKTLPASQIRMRFLGGVDSIAVPEGLLPGKVNYIVGKDPKKWEIGLPTFARVRYRNVYPGVDVVYYGNQQNVEFDLNLAPGSKPEAIRLKFEGSSKVQVDESGSLLLGSATGDLTLKAPLVYQEIGGKRLPIEAKYRKLTNGEITFSLAHFDHSKNLVIDPTIMYSTFVGGGSSYTYPQAIAIDSSNNAYIAGYTYAADFPTVSAAIPAYHGNSDGFITKLNPAGTALVYSTYVGGSGYDEFYGIAVDGSGAAWVTGQSNSTDFPTMTATQGASGGNYDAVVVKLSASGTLAFSTYLGGPNTDSGRAVALDGSGNAYVTGYALAGFPTTSSVVATTNQGSFDGFVAKYSSSGSLLYSTYLGGSGADYAYGIASDSGGNAYVTGLTYSAQGFKGAPIGGAQSVAGGGGDAFAAKLNPTATAISYFTFIGGSQYDVGHQIAVDASGNAFVAGETSSVDLAASPGAYQSTLFGATNGFVAKLNSSGSAFTYKTYIGSNRTDSLNGLALEASSGSVYLAGATDGNQFPSMNPLQASLPGTSTSALFQSVNSGASYTPIDSGLRGTVNSISPDPTLGTIVASTDVGIFKTTNGGGNWAMQSSISTVALSRSPAAPNTIYAVNGSSAYKSTDSGSTWSFTGSLGSCCSYDVVADPQTANIVYAFYQNYGLGVLKSIDGGVTWSAVNTGLPSLTIQSMVAGSDDALYVALSSGGIYKSTNQGGSWTATPTGLPSPFFPNTIAISASSPSVLYVADSVNVYKSANGGSSWAITAAVPNGSIATIGVSPQNSQVVYSSSFFSPVVYTSPDGGSSWNAASTGLGNATPNQFVFTPGNGTQLFALAAVTSASWIAKLNPAGGALVYSTFLGGSGGGYLGAVATNGAGDAFLAGYTYSSDFPISQAAYQPTYLGNGQAFVSRISDSTSACSYFVSPGNQLVYGPQQDIAFSVVAPSACSWSASSNQPWAVVISGASGAGTGSASLQVSANTGASTRTASLTIAGQNIILTQPSNNCSYSLSYNANVPTVGGSVPVQLTTGATCDWNVLNDAPSAVTVSGATSPGPATINLTVAANPSPGARSLRLYIADQYVSLNQSGQCSFTVTSPGPVLWSGGLVTVPVSTSSACTWTSSSNVPWATVSGPAGTTGSGSVTFKVTANPLGSGPGSRTGTVTVAGQTITLTQLPPSTSVGIFRSGFFWILDVDGNQALDIPPDQAFPFGGIAGDIPITGDWNGDGHTKVGVYRSTNGLFILDTNGNGVFDAGDAVYKFFNQDPTDVPVVGDWNGDGRTKIGLFRQGFLWILDTNGNGVFDSGIDQAFPFGGIKGDVPVVGDWTGNGKSKVGVVRFGYFWILDANGNGTFDGTGPGQDFAFPFGGIQGDVPVVGDWNGTGTSKVGVFRLGFFWVLDANGNHLFDGTGPGQDLAFPFGGIGGDKPVTGRW